MTRQSEMRAAKASELLERLEGLTRTGDPDSFALRRVEQDARRLMSADAAGAHVVRGVLAALRGDADEVRRHYKIALQQSTSHSIVYANYAMSLLHIGESTEAFEAAREAFERARDSAEALDQLIRIAVVSGRFVQAHELCGYWRKLFPDQGAPYEEDTGILAEAVERGAFSEEGAREVLDIAHEVRQNERARLMETVIVRDDLEPDGFFFKFHVVTSNDTAAQLNERLIDEVIGREWLRDDPSLKFTPMFVGTIQDGGNRERSA